MRVDDATVLFPETAEDAPHVSAQLRDQHSDETGLSVFSPRPNLGAHGRNRKDHGEEEDKHNSLRGGKASHKILSEAAPGRAGVGRSGASPENRVSEGE